MWNKIKTFLQNRIVITVEFILIGICCAGLILAGVTVEQIAKVPAMVAGILGAISAFILYIIGMTKK
jgi:hypothetical protein